MAEVYSGLPALTRPLSRVPSMANTRDLVHGFGVRALLTIEAVAEAAACVLAEVLCVAWGIFFWGGGVEAEFAEAFRTAESLVLQLQGLLYGHALPAEDALLRFSVPALHFYFRN
jgi:hypothetical protein